MPEIIPAIMPKDFKDLEEKASLFAGLVDAVQIDIMDGIFVPEKTWPYKDDTAEFYEIVGKERSYPKGRQLLYEADLMISRPETCLKGWIETHLSRIIVHLESVGDLKYFWKNLGHNKYPQIENDGIQGFEFGLAINIDTPNEALYTQIDDDYVRKNKCVDFVQFMGIAKIGYQGEPFDERVLPKIEAFRERYSDIMISVDGGVNLDSAPRLIKAGANRLVAGSAILKSGDIKGAIEKFRKLEEQVN